MKSPLETDREGVRGEESGLDKRGNKEVRGYHGIPSEPWISLQMAAACICLSLVVMVENWDMAAAGEQSHSMPESQVTGTTAHQSHSTPTVSRLKAASGDQRVTARLTAESGAPRQHT